MGQKGAKLTSVHSTYIYVDGKGHHAIKCRKSANRHERHSELNNIMVSADVPAVLEPTGLARNDGKRVDDMTLIPWSKGSKMITVKTNEPRFKSFLKQRLSRAMQ